MARRHDTWMLDAIGGVLLAGYVLQAVLGVTWPALARLQMEETYQVASGLGLAAYLLFQWSLLMRRARDPARAVRHHKLVGVLAPVVLYLHASGFAYGYLILLAWTFLVTVLVGLVHQPMIQLRIRWLFTVWFVVHVVAAMALVVLGGYHVVIALAYE